MIGGIYFAGAPFAGMLRLGAQAASLAASAVISFTGTATLSRPPAYLAADAHIVWTAARASLSVPIDTTVGISIGGIPVTSRVRVQGVTIRDVLNDAPNTCNFTIEGEAPAVGQPVRVTLGPRLLFAGSIQAIDQSYESRPDLVAWYLSAIDDTPAGHRPFASWFSQSATTIAQFMTLDYGPGFSTAGIQAGLPAVTIVFDGSETFIACLVRLANMIGGYCKIEDKVVYLFTTDPTDPPDPIDIHHRFLASPPVTINTDSSQLRTRVYGKGYGETVQAELAAGETLYPIQDGVMFPALGGEAIAGLTADGAQSERFRFASVVLGGGGSLVGPGSSPGSAPALELQAGSGVDSGLHTVSVAFVTANGKSLAGPAGSITAGTHAPPASAPLAATAITGTGPDQGLHDYAASFVTAYGETVPSPISNAVATSAASGQLPQPGAPTVDFQPLLGTGAPNGYFDYKVTFTNATGETQASPQSNQTEAKPTAPVQPSGYSGSVSPTTGGNIEPGTYFYWYTAVTAIGESLPTSTPLICGVNTAGAAINVPLAWNTDPRVTGLRLYRGMQGNPPGNQEPALSRRVASLPQPTQNPQYFLDTQAQSAIQSQPPPPTVDTTTQPQNRLNLTYIPTGPAGTVGRKVYRRWLTGGDQDWYLVVTLNNNTATTHVDAAAHNNGAAAAPPSNTTGTAVQRIPVTNIPIGPPGVTSRKLYRRFNGAGTFKLVTTIANNSGTTYTDGVANSALGASALTTATAIGNQIRATIPTGAAAVTAREIYMSPVANATRRLVATLPDNTTATVTITASDATIAGGSLEPGVDTSGLQQPQGQVNPGAVVLPVASAAPFRAAGGWVVLGGGQVVRYTGISGQTLVGIPATGPGAITTTVLYGQQALPSPMLVGITGQGRVMQKGSAVHLWLQRDNLQAQAEHAARTGGDGIVEFLIVDARRGLESLATRCDADLALFARPIVTVSYATRDLKTKSGKSVLVDLAAPIAFTGTLTIQEVTITEIGIAPGLPPRFTVKASSVRFSLEDTLRRLIAVGPVSVNA